MIAHLYTVTLYREWPNASGSGQEELVTWRLTVAAPDAATAREAALRSIPVGARILVSRASARRRKPDEVVIAS